MGGELLGLGKLLLRLVFIWFSLESDRVRGRDTEVRRVDLLQFALLGLFSECDLSGVSGACVLAAARG